MNKKVILLLLPFFLTSCNKGRVSDVSSPFEDSYSRIGINGEYIVDLDSITTSERIGIEVASNTDDLLTNTLPIENDKLVTSYKRHEETRDLKYAYFGGEDASASLCSMLSSDDIQTRYPNNNVINQGAVTVNKAISNLQNQVANGGIIKNHTEITDYIYDSCYRNSTYVLADNKYGIRESVSNNFENPTISQLVDENTTRVDSDFELTPYTDRIESHFKIFEGNFNVFLKNNNAIYGKCYINNKHRYLIKEGYSVYTPYSTTVGRNYKAVKNYFYEALLENYGSDSEIKMRFTNFRFYSEMLILSEVYFENVPIIYLDKPVLVEYSEVKYEISYDSQSSYHEIIN